MLNFCMMSRPLKCLWFLYWFLGHGAFHEYTEYKTTKWGRTGALFPFGWCHFLFLSLLKSRFNFLPSYPALLCSARALIDQPVWKVTCSFSVALTTKLQLTVLWFCAPAVILCGTFQQWFRVLTTYLEASCSKFRIETVKLEKTINFCAKHSCSVCLQTWKTIVKENRLELRQTHDAGILLIWFGLYLSQGRVHSHCHFESRHAGFQHQLHPFNL